MLENTSEKNNIIEIIREKQKCIAEYKEKESDDKNNHTVENTKPIDDIASDIPSIFNNICNYYIDIISHDTFCQEINDIDNSGNPSVALNEFDASVLEFIVFYTSWINTAAISSHDKINIQIGILEKSVTTIQNTSQIAQKMIRNKNLKTKSDLYILYTISATDFSKNIINANMYLPASRELDDKTVEMHRAIIEMLKFALELCPIRHDENFIKDCIREQYGKIRIISPKDYDMLKKSDPEFAPKTQVLPIVTIALAIIAIIIYFITR